MELLTEVYSEIRMNLNVNSEDANAQRHVRELIGQFIGWVSEISEYLDSTEWNGEDVMGIFFNEFKVKSIGLDPITHPPGDAIFTFPYTPNKEPIK